MNAEPIFRTVIQKYAAESDCARIQKKYPMLQTVTAVIYAEKTQVERERDVLESATIAITDEVTPFTIADTAKSSFKLSSGIGSIEKLPSFSVGYAFLATLRI
jgi:hypothetical protein